ncbi:twin arginine translocase protein A [Shigella sonnei]|uniref:twin-arginine translocase TatA/TatE family subunit n=1 Tax=Shigella sonnei TaxID=624 RepID=UPI000663DA98|nr:twin-arginine translocase TatA/TatE family subunit [Shigella sonnei]CSP94108.1 twin arginine translocase protein A [Shigella sonnei]
MGEISITKLLVVAALVVLLFGTKKLRTLGGDRAGRSLNILFDTKKPLQKANASQLSN